MAILMSWLGVGCKNATFSMVCPRSSLSKFYCCFQPGLHNQLAEINVLTGFGSLKVDRISQVWFCTSPYRSLQSSSSIDQSFVIWPKGDMFLSFTTLLIESTCKKNSVQHQSFTVLCLYCIHHTNFDCCHSGCIHV